jgi:5-bromo-4-chloroindolyl phosphate hydrolysis protein
MRVFCIKDYSFTPLMLLISKIRYVMIYQMTYSKVMLEVDMNNRGNLNLGEEIRNIVQDAVNNRDFNRLNQDINHAVNGALDEVKRSIERKRENRNSWNNNTWNNDTRNNNSWSNNTRNSRHWKVNDDPRRNVRNSQAFNAGTTNGQSYNHNKPVPRPVKYTIPIGQVSSTLFTVFGVIGSTGFGIASAVLAIIGYLTENSVLHIITFALLACFTTCIILSMNGSRIRKRLKRFQRYIIQMNGRNYSLIKDFSAATGRSNKYTIKDLQKMINIGMFPEGHIDDKKTCFMLNRESYEQYLNLQENMKMKDMENLVKNKEESKSSDKAQDDTTNKKDTLNPEVRKAIDEGRQFVQNIRNANIAIPGEEISRKLDRLEAVTGKIFDYVESHPEKLPEIKKFTEYFLPTTLKILDAYREFDYQPVEGENISTAKKEIENTMDTINLAFENLLDGLFVDAAMDISTDISVLQTMFAQEGLTQKNGKL